MIRKEAKKRIGIAVRILISVSLLSFLIIRNLDNLKEINKVLRELNIPLVVLAAFFYFLSIFTIVFRWDSLLKAQKVNISKKFLLQAVLIGFFYNNLLPTSVAGDAFRVYDIRSNKNVPASRGMASVTLERFGSFIIGTVFVLVFIILDLAGYFHQEFLNRSLIIAILAVTTGMFFLFFALMKPSVFKIDVLFKKIKFLSKIELRLEKYQGIFVDYWRVRKKALLACLLYSIIIHFLVTISYYIALRSVGPDLRFLYFLFIIPFSSTAANLPISIGGIGVRENTLVLILLLMGIQEGEAFIFSFIILFIILFNALIGGIIYLFRSICFSKPA